MMYVIGYGAQTWEERKLRASELFARAQDQGFRCLAGLFGGKSAGERYLQLLENMLQTKG
jgi:hypothetical protein